MPARSVAEYVRLPDPRSIREVDDEIVEELQFHLEMRTRDNIDMGMASR